MPSHYPGPDEDQAILDTYVKLMRAANSTIDRVVPVLSRYGLTVSQFGVLEALLHLGPMCQKDLAGKMLQTGGNMTMVLSNLEKRGLVTRERPPADRRFVEVALSPAGRQLVEEAFPPHLEVLREAFARLEPEERSQLGALCRKLGRGQ